MNMKRILYFLIVTMAFVGCKSKQSLINGNEQLVTIPCASIVSDQFATRALGTANSTNLQMAKDKAIAVARRELVSSMQTAVQRVIDTYAASYDEDTSSRFMSMTKDVSRLTSNQMLVGSTIACEKVTQSVEPHPSRLFQPIQRPLQADAEHVGVLIRSRDLESFRDSHVYFRIK